MAHYITDADGNLIKVAGNIGSYKEYSMVPSTNYISGIFDMSQKGYHTAYYPPANGYVNIMYNGSSSDLWVQNQTAHFEVSFPSRTNAGVIIPVSKGDKIVFYSTNAGNTTYSFSRFIYSKE